MSWVPPEMPDKIPIAIFILYFQMVNFEHICNRIFRVRRKDSSYTCAGVVIRQCKNYLNTSVREVGSLNLVTCRLPKLRHVLHLRNFCMPEWIDREPLSTAASGKKLNHDCQNVIRISSGAICNFLPSNCEHRVLLTVWLVRHQFTSGFPVRNCFRQI